MPSGAMPSGPIRTAADAARFLEGLIDLERMREPRAGRLSLAPIEALLERVGRPERGLRVLHVAGSKGKGSTALLAEALLRAGALRVGTFTSPHLERWTERFRIDGAEVEEARLAAAVECLSPHVEFLRGPGLAPSFFDATTAAAFLLFQEARVQVAVVEVGLGGRLDSTNVVEPAVTCVTSIELEHVRTLGGTLAAIASEKAGILKPGVPAVLGALPDEARAVVEARAAALGCPLARLGQEIGAAVREAGVDGLALRLRDGAFEVEARLPVLGAHQAGNAALALACVRRLGILPDTELAALAPRAFADARLPGRAELLGRAPWIVVDAAHTPASARALVDALAPLSRRRLHLVLSVSEGKDLASIARILAGVADEVTLTRADPRRSLEPAALAAAVAAAAPLARLRVVPNPHLALRAAREGLGREDLLCAAGSVYLAGLARSVFRPARPPEGAPAPSSVARTAESTAPGP
jgi:dihydrofolate synthase/folylpolyglutamate synthase